MSKMEEEYTIVIEKGEDGYFMGSVIEIPECHTPVKTVDKLMERMKEAISLCGGVKIPQ